MLAVATVTVCVFIDFDLCRLCDDYKVWHVLPGTTVVSSAGMRIIVSPIANAMAMRDVEYRPIFAILCGMMASAAKVGDTYEPRKSDFA